jgi:AAA domain
MAQRRGVRTKRPTARQQRENPEAIEVETADVEIHIEQLAATNPSINWLIHGPSGHGKTTLCGGAPNATFLSCERGSISAKRTGSKAGLMKAPDWEHMVAGTALAMKELGPDDWLIVDSLPRAQTLYIRWLLRMRHEENSSRDLDIPAIQDHQKWQNAYLRWVDSLIDAQFNVLAIATSMYKTDENGDDLVLPAISGKDYAIAGTVCAAFDIVSYMSVAPQRDEDGNAIRRLLFQPFPPYFAKDWYGCFGRQQDVYDGEFGVMAEFIQMIKDSDKADA